MHCDLKSRSLTANIHTNRTFHIGTFWGENVYMISCLPGPNSIGDLAPAGFTLGFGMMTPSLQFNFGFFHLNKSLLSLSLTYWYWGVEEISSHPHGLIVPGNCSHAFVSEMFS